MIIFFSNQIKEDLIRLEPDETAHATKVLRIQKGDSLYITDGIGNLFYCKYLETQKKEAVAQIISSKNYSLRDQSGLHLAVAPTKNIARYEWLVEKATEIGVGQITPLICHHSERKQVNSDRLQKIAISAMKQSLITILPKINPPILFADFIQPNHLLAHLKKDGSSIPFKNLDKLENMTILIGPEGDFSESEIDSASITISLGNNRLRTETAALVACTIYNTLL
jgi:16S rRNA (uracil1498-N3)-methyltransferase